MSRTALSVTSLISLLLALPISGFGKTASPARLSGNLPLAFEPNRGQAQPGVDYAAHGNRYSVSLKSGDAAIALREHGAKQVDLLHLRLLGSRPKAPALGAAQLPGCSNYIRGRNPEGWIEDVPQFARVQYSTIYPGIDLVYYGNQEQLEYDFLVSPNADPSRIAMRLGGARTLSVDDNGNLIVALSEGNLLQKRPFAYQIVNGKPVEVSVHYRIQNANVIGFQIAAYDRSQPLTIDPVLLYSTYFGGSDSDGTTDVAVDAQGNAYIAGATFSADFPAVNAAQRSINLFGDDAFVSKISRDGSAVLFSTFLGGSRSDVASAAAVDANGNVYVTGQTNSPDFPVLNAYQDRLRIFNPNGGARETSYDGFVSKLTAAGAVAYSTY